MYITEIQADGALSTALTTFSATCGANSATLGLSPGDLLAISAAATNFATELASQSTAKSAARAATSAKDAQKHASKLVVARWAKTFRANPAITDELLASLLLAPHATPGSKTPPTIPMNLVANSNGTGIILLQWLRNGNIQSTTFVIEHRASPTGEWLLTGTTTKASFPTAWTPGSYVEYRVTAARHEQLSPPSVSVVLWSGGAGAFLSVAA